MERVLVVATGVARLEDAVPPALVRGWTVRPVRGELAAVLGTNADAVEFRRPEIPFSVVAVEDRGYGAATLLAHDEVDAAIEPRRFGGAAFQRACCIGYPAVMELLEALRLPSGRWMPGTPAGGASPRRDLAMASAGA